MMEHQNNDTVNQGIETGMIWPLWDTIKEHAPDKNGFICSYSDLPLVLYKIPLPAEIREVIIYDYARNERMSSCHLRENSDDTLTAESVVSLVTMHREKFGSTLTGILLHPSNDPSILEVSAVFEPCA